MPKQEPLVPLLSALRDLIAWFEKVQTKHVIIGGVATSILGYPRVTKDVDAIVFINEDKIENFLKTGSELGFIPRLSDAVDFARKKRVLLVRHQSSGIDVDISLGALPFEKETVARASVIKVGNISVRLPSVEDLIILKAVAHRSRDLIDIESLMEVHIKLDLRRIRKWIREFSSVLEIPEILKDFEGIIGKRKKSKK